MSAIAQPETATGMTVLNKGRAFLLASYVYIGVCVVISIIGLIAKLPDLPSSHAHTDSLTVGQVLVGNGTIMSPPLVLLIPIGLLAWGSTASRVWVARVTTAILTLLVAASVKDETQGFNDKPALFSSGKWHLCIALGVVFDIMGFVVVIAGILWVFARRTSRQIH
jgi:hypothetical protein